MRKIVKHTIRMVLARHFGRKKDGRWIINRNINYVYLMDVIMFIKKCCEFIYRSYMEIY